MAKTNSKLDKTLMDKAIIGLFLIFIIIALVVLFQAPVQITTTPTSALDSVPITGQVVSSAELTKIQYNTNEPMSGKVFLRLTPGTYPQIEILPPETMIHVLISGNITKCSEKYVCSSGQTVSWYYFNATTKECSLLEADPEGKCCTRGYGCNQIITDNSFEASGLRTSGLRPDWIPLVTGLNPTSAVGVESGGFVDDIYEVSSDYSGFANSLDVIGTPTTTTATIKQDLSARNVHVQDFTGVTPPYGEEAVTYASLSSPKTLKFALRYSAAGYGSSGYYFEIIIRALSGSIQHNLHYYAVAPGSIGFTPPVSDIDKYILIDVPTEDYWFNFTNQFYNDWITAFGQASYTDKIVGIELVSYGKLLNTIMYGQKVNFDDVTLTKYHILSNDCAARSTAQALKKCCLKESGMGNYYGEQLNCSEGKECWSNCMGSSSLKIRNFISKAETPGKDKYNLTEGECGFISEGSWIDLEDYCGQGGVGKGYTACLSNTSTCQGFGGINLYKVPISSLLQTGFKTPSQNGSYNLVMSVEYMPSWYEETYGADAEPIILTKTSVPFYVGVSVVSNCSDTFYDCLTAPIITETNWTTCYANSQTRTKTLNCTYAGNAVCERYKLITQVFTQNCTTVISCTENDYSCTDWQPEICSPSSQQSRQCSLINTDCSSTAPGSVTPATSQDCSVDVVAQAIQSMSITRSQAKTQLQQAGWSSTEIETILTQVYGVEEAPSMSWIIYAVLIAVVLGAGIVVLVLTLGKKKEKGLDNAYPELTSYIRDALTTGATKQEITTKLQEAGWPKDAIESSFRASMA